MASSLYYTVFSSQPSCREDQRTLTFPISSTAIHSSSRLRRSLTSTLQFTEEPLRVSRDPLRARPQSFLAFLQHLSYWPTPCSFLSWAPTSAPRTPVSPRFLPTSLATHLGYLQRHSLFFSLPFKCWYPPCFFLSEDLVASTNPKALSPDQVSSSVFRTTSLGNFDTRQTSQITHPDSFIWYLLTTWNQYTVWTYLPTQIWSFFFIPFLGEWQHQSCCHPSKNQQFIPDSSLSSPSTLTFNATKASRFINISNLAHPPLSLPSFPTTRTKQPQRTGYREVTPGVDMTG